jgi:hypothetical protein
MNATEIVAIVGAISTPAIAIAGYIFNERRSRDDRAATRELAEDSHAHERQLAEGERDHAERLRRNERLYDARRDTYLDLLRQFLLEVQIVQRTEDLVGLREPPDPPTEEEWRDLRARVGAFGSAEVVHAVEEFDSQVRTFHNAVNVYRGMLWQNVGDEQPIPKGIGPHTPMDEYREMERQRTLAVKGYEEVATLIREELGNL